MSLNALMEMTLSHVATSTPCDYLMDIPTHIRLIKMLLEYLKGLVDAKVSV